MTTTVAIALLVVMVVVVQTGAIIVGDRHNRLGLKVIASANAIARDSTDSQLRQIHTLVNSDMTAARLGELNQTVISLTLMRKLLVLEKAAGLDVSDDQELIRETEERIVYLRAVLADRHSQQDKVEAQQIAELRSA